MKKYPVSDVEYDRDIDFIAPPVHGIDEDETKRVISYICSFKRESAKSIMGFSTDHVQDIIKYQPSVIPYLMNFFELIIRGEIPKDAQDNILRGRGIPLKGKDAGKPRPINIDCPFHKIAAHIIEARCREKVIDICGDNQLGNAISGGAEILIHSVRTLLELHPEYGVLKIDVENAFNSISRSSVLNALSKVLPETVAYNEMTLRRTTSVIYNDRKADLCMNVSMTTGVCQGNPTSSMNFNVTQAPILRNLREMYGDVFILSFHDDHYAIGTDETLLALLDDLDREFATIGLKRNDSKSQYYCKMPTSDDISSAFHEKGVSIVPPRAGITVAGSPVGSDDFITSAVLKVVEESINSQLDKLRRVLLRPTPYVQGDLHMVFTILRLCMPAQLNHLLRTCPPACSSVAAARLDNILQQFVIDIMDAEKYITMAEREIGGEFRKIMLSRIHLAIRHGGLGIVSSVNVLKGAYLGSLALCTNWMSKIIPDLKDKIRSDEGILIPTYAAFEDCLISAKHVAADDLKHLNIDSIFDQSFSKVQNIVSTNRQQKLSDMVTAALPNGGTLAGFGVNRTRKTQYDQELIRQHMANANKINSAFLTANPASALNKMSDSSFCVAIQHRLLLPVRGDKRYCVCSEPVGPFLGHAYHCHIAAVRSRIRPNLHSYLKMSLVGIFKHYVNTQKLNDNVMFENNEPKLIKYYDVKPGVNTMSSVTDEQSTGALKVRADIAITVIDVGKTFILDVTYADPHAESHQNLIKPGEAADAYAKTKLKEYDDWDLTKSSAPFYIFAAETTCILGSSAIQFVKDFVKELHGDPLHVVQLIQQISVALHTARAIAFDITSKELTTVNRPEVPLIVPRTGNRNINRSNDPSPSHRSQSQVTVREEFSNSQLGQ
jgi:hypothetical protein